jgi:LPS O-antigen subunit length determinant protein (WzzB/FepE family)
VSIATPTKISKEVAPNPLKVEMEVTFSIILGITAINAKNKAPKNVSLFNVFCK